MVSRAEQLPVQGDDHLDEKAYTAAVDAYHDAWKRAMSVLN